MRKISAFIIIMAIAAIGFAGCSGGSSSESADGSIVSKDGGSAGSNTQSPNSLTVTPVPETTTAKDVELAVKMTVSDKEGKTIEGAVVTIIGKDGKVIGSGTTDSTGATDFKVNADSSTTGVILKIEAPGYKTVEVGIENIPVSSEITKNYQLEKVSTESSTGGSTPSDNTGSGSTTDNGSTDGSIPSGNSSGTDSGSTNGSTPSENTNGGSTGTAEPPKPVDTIDVNTNSNSGSFDFSTEKEVTINITVTEPNGTPVKDTVVTASDKEGKEIGKAVTDELGKADVTVKIDGSDSSVVIKVDNPSFENKEIVIGNVTGNSEVSGNIQIEKKEDAAPVAVDTDKDGIADSQDQFPSDPALAWSVEKEYTIVFEDSYPNKGDADCNDFVVRFTVKEYQNSANKIVKIDITSKALACGGEYNNQFAIRINGQKYTLIKDGKKDLFSFITPYKYYSKIYNALRGQTFLDAKVNALTVTFPAPVSRDEIGLMPYDPFMYVNGTATEVHLPSLDAKYRDPNGGFPWAIMVPSNWLWPYEETGSSIYKAYPEFTKWCESKGAENQDWYLHPDANNVFNYLK